VTGDPPDYRPSDPEPIELEPIELEPIDLASGEPDLAPLSTPSGASTRTGRSSQTRHSTETGRAWAPGWYADPWVAGQYRMWNGEAWTGETGRAGPSDTVPPVAPASTPAYAPISTPRYPQSGPPVRPGRSGRTAAIVAAVVVLVLIAGAIGYAIESSTESDSSSSTTTQPPSATTPGSAAPAPSTADRLALSSLVVRQSDVDSTRTVVLIPNGNRTTEPTLDLCNGTFPSEKLRVARLQVAELNASGSSALLSTEAVTYKHATGGAQAFAELRRVRAACPHQPVTSPVGEGTDETTFKAAPDGSWPRTKSVERLAYSFTTTAAGKSTPSVAVYLRRGRVLMGVYFPQPSGAQPAVGGKTTIAGIVGLFELRMARLPASVVNG
jgi:hypothetical protein